MMHIQELTLLNPFESSDLLYTNATTDLPIKTRENLSLYNFNFEVITVNASGNIIERKQSQAEYFPEKLTNGIILEMVYIPGGSFLMGSPQKEVKDNEKPLHQVNIPSFFMSKYPITQSQWQAIMGSNLSYFKGTKRPVEQVSWHDCVKFCQKLSQKTGKTYRLPTEAEWEYACKANTNSPFYFGETLTTDLANYDGRYFYSSEPQGKYRKKTTQVGQFPPNAFGLYDLHGNVWEWCLDYWYDNYNDAPNDGSARVQEQANTNNNIYRVVRGGSWYYYPSYCRATNRHRYLESILNNNIGLRVVCTIPYVST